MAETSPKSTKSAVDKAAEEAATTSSQARHSTISENPPSKADPPDGVSHTQERGQPS